MANYIGHIKPTVNPDDEKKLLELVQEKYPIFNTDKYDSLGQIYFDVDEDVVIEFVNTVEETFRDIWFDIFCIDQENNIAITITYRNRKETVCQYDQIDTATGRLKKLNETVEIVDDECIRLRQEEREKNKEE